MVITLVIKCEVKITKPQRQNGVKETTPLTPPSKAKTVNCHLKTSLSAISTGSRRWANLGQVGASFRGRGGKTLHKCKTDGKQGFGSPLHTALPPSTTSGQHILDKVAQGWVGKSFLSLSLKTALTVSSYQGTTSKTVVLSLIGSFSIIPKIFTTLLVLVKPIVWIMKFPDTVGISNEKRLQMPERIYQKLIPPFAIAQIEWSHKSMRNCIGLGLSCIIPQLCISSAWAQCDLMHT